MLLLWCPNWLWCYISTVKEWKYNITSFSSLVPYFFKKASFNACSSYLANLNQFFAGFSLFPIGQVEHWVQTRYHHSGLQIFEQCLLYSIGHRLELRYISLLMFAKCRAPVEPSYFSFGFPKWFSKIPRQVILARFEFLQQQKQNLGRTRHSNSMLPELAPQNSPDLVLNNFIF